MTEKSKIQTGSYNSDSCLKETKKSTNFETVFKQAYDNNLNLDYANTSINEIIDRFDKVINKLNPDNYYKNHPQCEDGSGLLKCEAKETRQISGMLLEVEDSLNIGRERINYLDNNLIVQLRRIVSFFEENL